MGVSVNDQYAGMGAYVVSVEPDGGAAAAGVRPGDLIVALGDHEITCINDLTPAMKHYKVGDTTTVTVFRGRQTLELTITFGERPHGNTTVQPSGNGDMPSSGSYEDWFDYFFGDGND
jgi:serine protease Do